MATLPEVVHPEKGNPPIPRWAWGLAAALLAAAVGVLVWGRGGTAVVVGVGLAFLALAALLLSVPDGDPGASP
ncbi:MAG: hypothetical protein ACRDJN_23290 [Chloroflexota bacterium]